MPTFVFDRDLGVMVDKETRLPMLNQEERSRPLQTPQTFGDLPGYRSPIDGKWVEGRRARQYDLQSNDCVDAGDRPTKKLKNERFASKHGLQHMME